MIGVPDDLYARLRDLPAGDRLRWLAGLDVHVEDLDWGSSRLERLYALGDAPGLMTLEECREAYHAALDLLHDAVVQLDKRDAQVAYWKRRALEREGRWP